MKASRRLAEPRQQTLRATLDWSYALLTDQEQQLFERRSVFAGGWELEAVEAVCAGDGIESDQILDLLARLFDKSLVMAYGGEDGPIRYGLLETLRQYGQRKLSQRGGSARTRDRHAQYFLDHAERSEPSLQAGGGLIAHARLHQRVDNLRAALRWLFAIGDVGRAQRLAGALGRFWFFAGDVAEGESNLTRALAMPGGDAPTAGRAKCVHGISIMGLGAASTAVVQSMITYAE